jgi:two-component system, OmpR family, response regulator
MTGGPLIYVVDDEAGLRGSLGEYLGLQGFTAVQAANAAEFRRAWAKRPGALAILDIAMPGEDGLSLARWLREQAPGVGILMLTASGDPVDKVVGLELGADDYMAKPFQLREVLARVRAILRRTGGGAARAPVEGRIRFGRATFDAAAGKLIADDGSEDQLTGQEIALLRAFAERPGQILTRERILALAQERGVEVFDRSIDTRINRIRQKVEPNPKAPTVIKTVRGAGYLFDPKS